MQKLAAASGVLVTLMLLSLHVEETLFSTLRIVSKGLQETYSYPPSCGIMEEKSVELKIFAYDVPADLNLALLNASGGLQRVTSLDNSNQQFALEYFGSQTLLRSPYITENPEEADLFFVNYFPESLRKARHLGTADQKEATRKLWGVVATNPWYQRFQGKDHFVFLAHPYEKNRFPEFLQNFIRITVDPLLEPDEVNYVNWFQNIIVPYYDTAQLHMSLDEKSAYMEHPSACLTSFVGSLKPKFTVRNVLHKDFLEMYPDVPVSGHGLMVEPAARGPPGSLDCYTRINDRYALNFSDISLTLQRSAFCIIPPGDSASSKRFYDALFALCIPVMISDAFFLAYEGQINYKDFVIFVPEEEVLSGRRNIFNWLRKNISKAEIERRRKAILQVMHHFQFHSPDIWKEDAIDMMIQELNVRAEVIRRYRRVASSKTHHFKS